MAGAVLDHHGSGMLHALGTQALELLRDDGFHLGLQFRHNRRSYDCLLVRGLLEKIYCMRSGEATPVSLKDNGLGSSY